MCLGLAIWLLHTGLGIGLAAPLPPVDYHDPQSPASCATTAVAFIGDELDSEASCAFYLNLEGNRWCSRDVAARWPSPVEEYPLLYGYKYCRRFAGLYNEFKADPETCRPLQEATFANESTLAWIESTMVCLQNALNSSCDAIPPDHGKCRAIGKAAFASHPPCYVQASSHLPNGVCGLCPEHLAQIVAAIEPRDALLPIGLMQLLRTTALCGKSYLDRVEDALASRLFTIAPRALTDQKR